MTVDFERVNSITESDKFNFKNTLAGHGYVELLKIFQAAPESEDKRKAIEHLKNCFTAHLELWVAMGKN